MRRVHSKCVGVPLRGEKRGSRPPCRQWELRTSVGRRGRGRACENDRAPTPAPPLHAPRPTSFVFATGFPQRVPPSPASGVSLSAVCARLNPQRRQRHKITSYHKSGLCRDARGNGRSGEQTGPGRRKGCSLRRVSQRFLRKTNARLELILIFVKWWSQNRKHKLRVP